MKKLLLFFSILVASATLHAQTSETKKNLDITLISYVELVKLNQANPSKSEKKQLTAFQYVDFADKWNHSKTIGADKYNITYYIYVYFTDGTKRQFTIGGSKVQEQRWMTMDFGDKLYFDKLWEAIK